MTKEEKQLLLIDLCARLPYGTEISLTNGTSGMITTINILPHGTFVRVYFNRDNVEDVLLENIKPYLRSMSSMTEEEKREYHGIDSCAYTCPEEYAHVPAADRIDWLNAHYFDYRGLIHMGLALEAKEGIYKTE